MYVYSVLCCFSWPKQVHVTLQNTLVLYLKPVHKIGQKRYANLIAQKIYDELCKLELHKIQHKYKDIIVVSPETAYPFFLNKHMNHVKLWTCALPSNTHFLLGSQRLEEVDSHEQVFQTVFWLHEGLIMQYYDKKHRVPFVEYVPNNWKHLTWAQNLFLRKKKGFDISCKESITCFYISKELMIVPQICSELFMKLNCNILKQYKKAKGCCQLVVCFFVNDSWFMSYFKNILRFLSKLRALEINIPIFYISHTKAEVFSS
jgi:apolipoprotein N-acyltransferase